MANSPDYDDGINKFNQDQTQKQAQEENIANVKPKISKKVASLFLQYGIIAFTVGGIFYKMFIQDTSGSVKNKQPIQFVQKDVSKDSDFGSAKIEQVKKATISDKTDISGLDIGYKARSSLDVPVPSLELPKVPEIKIDDKIATDNLNANTASKNLIETRALTKQDEELKKKNLDQRMKKKEESPLLMPNSSPLEIATSLENKIDKEDKNEEQRVDLKKDGSGTSDVQTNGQVNSAMGEMFLVKGAGGSSGGNNTSNNSGDKKSDGIIIFNGSRFSEVEKNSESTTQVQKIKNLSKTILTGKIIEAVLETSINTQIPGTVRAIVARDVYAETGLNIIIPAGSRLYGTYISTSTPGDSRVNIMWNRIMRPDAMVISISAQAIDESGQAGISGEVDSGYGKMFSNALLVSALSLATGIITQKLFNLSGQTQIVNSNGSIATTNVTPANAAVQNVVNLSTNIAKQLTQSLTQQVKQNITVDQGTRVNVSVNQDLTAEPYIKLAL